MIASEPIGWVNTGLPLVVLAGLAGVLPRFLVSGDTRSQQAVMVSIFGSAVGLLISGGLVFAAVYGLGGVGIGAAFSNTPVATGVFFLRLSALAALLWGPVLGLVWFSMAQGVEARRGADIARGAL